MRIAKRIVMYILLLLILPIIVSWVFLAQPGLRDNSRSLIKVDSTRLRKHVDVLSQKFSPRSFRDIGNLNACADYIRDEFAAAGGQTSEQQFKISQETYRNVVTRFGPYNGLRIIVGAHYDAFESTPGADDNASGVAALIELAHALSKASFALPVELLAFSLEEPPFFRTPDMGSAKYARKLKTEGVNVRAMICLEMVGYFSEVAGSQSFPVPLLRLFYPSRGNFIALIGNTGQGSLLRTVKARMRGVTDLQVYSLRAPRFVPGIDLSDHINFWNEGYPAVMVTDSAFYRNSEYHQSGDIADRLDYSRLGDVVALVYEAVTFLAGDGN